MSHGTFSSFPRFFAVVAVTPLTMPAAARVETSAAPSPRNGLTSRADPTPRAREPIGDAPSMSTGGGGHRRKHRGWGGEGATGSGGTATKHFGPLTCEEVERSSPYPGRVEVSCRPT
jgi:hypothetical protein